MKSPRHIHRHDGAQERAAEPRILLFSQRNIFKALFRCSLYEFEDVIGEVDSVEFLAPRAALETFRHRVSRKFAYHLPVSVNPGLEIQPIERQYDVFLAICGAPQDLLFVDAAKVARRSCRVSVCLLDELWAKDIAAYQYFLRILKTFDIVLLYYSGTVSPLSNHLNRQCRFLPPGVDTTAFCPYPAEPQRVVDVYSIGRRSSETHTALLELASNEGLFYLYDTIAGDQAIDTSYHRRLFAAVAKRSRYFIVNPGLIDRPKTRGNQIEIGNRYFEGAAAGAVMIGEQPNTAAFGELFGWRDSVIQLPYGSKDIGSVIHELDSQPVREEMIRRTNVREALTRHDWVYRWEEVLRILGMAPLPDLLRRKERLGVMADAVSTADPRLHGPGASK